MWRFLFGVLVGVSSLLGVIAGSVMWLEVLVDAESVPLRALVMERVEAGNCDNALALAHLGVVRRAYDAVSIWETVRYETECVNAEYATRYDAGVKIVLPGYDVFGEMNFGQSGRSSYSEWMSYEVSDAPQGTFLLVFRRIAFAERCYGALDMVGLPIELHLRRLIMLEFPEIDLVSDLPRARMDGCAAAARRLAQDARERADAETSEFYADWWLEHAEWLDLWADTMTRPPEDWLL